MSDLYRTNFGPVDDGSTDTMEAHDAWAEVQDQVRDGWLVPVTIDYRAAEVRRQLGGDGKEIVDAALGDDEPTSEELVQEFADRGGHAWRGTTDG